MDEVVEEARLDDWQAKLLVNHKDQKYEVVSEHLGKAVKAKEVDLLTGDDDDAKMEDVNADGIPNMMFPGL